MTRQTRGGDDYREVLDPRRRRKALLYRAALAIGVMVLLVIGLSLYDNDASDSPQSQGSVVREGVLPPPLPERTLVEETPVIIPRIDVSGSQEAAPAAEHEHELEDTGLDEARLDEADVVSDATPGAEARSPETEAGDAKLRDPVAETPNKPVAVAAVASVSPKAASPARATAPAPAPRVVPSDFQVLASDFVDPASADTLLGGLSDDGYQAESQSRVTVGPFARRADAERAMARLRSEHALRGIIVDAPSGTGFAVQLGVFAEASNAVALVRRLEASGHSAALHRRVMLGPYTDRQAAEAIVAELRASRALDARIIALPGR